MSIAARQTRSPRPFDPARGAEVAALWPAGYAALVAGAAGSSPHLAGLLARHAAWLIPAAEAPEAAAAEEIAAAAAAPPADLPGRLRLAKARLGGLVALADLAGAWPLETVTGTLTALADAAVGALLSAAVAAERGRGRLPASGAEAPAGGLCAFAMGKMGAGELNYSSDIDLVCFFDETLYSREDYAAARAALIRAVRRMTGWLSDNSAEGYVFRTDLRLRPDAAVTPVAMPMAGAEHYYEAEGRTWERAAWIKARPAAGDIAAGARFLATLRPFVWRRHLDFAAIQDAHDIRLRIRDHKRLGGPIRLFGHDLKLGRGGIREIEFFTQTRQLIAGGRDPALRVRGTVEGLARLAAAGWVPQAVADRLTAIYRSHREIEHRLQMIADAQTHSLPATAEGMARLAAFMGREEAELCATLSAALEEVDALTEGFFAPGSASRSASGAGAGPGGAPGGPPPAHGAAEDGWGAEVIARWPSYPALRSARAGEIFRRLRPGLLALLREAEDPDAALAAFDGFLAGLPAGVQVFSLFEANPGLQRLMAEIAASAPALARYLARNARVFDAVIGGSFFAPWPGAAALRDELAARLAAPARYEERLDTARAWAKEWHFRIGVHHLQGLIDAGTAGAQYADLAEAALSALWPVVVADFAGRHGDPPGRGAMVLGMGALGARRLNAASDLDLIVICDPGAAEMSAGPRPLPVRTYYARLTQALVTALSAPTAEGRLYEVDMRLRPSGRQGPVATTLAAFRLYQQEEAWTWEHLALTRARPVAGSEALGAEVEAFRAALLAEKAATPALRADVAAMRARLAAARPAEGPWDAKFGPGRLMEADLATQTAALLAGSPARTGERQRAAALAAGVLPEDGAAALGRAEALFWRMQATARLLGAGALAPDTLGTGARRLLLRETGAASEAALTALCSEVAAAAAAAFDRLLAEGGEDDSRS